MSSPATRVRGVAEVGAIGFAGAALGALLNLLLVVVVGRGLGVADTGTFFEVVGWFTIAVALLRLGADTALMRAWALQCEEADGPELGRTLWIAVTPVVAVSLVVAGLVHVLVPLLTEALAIPDPAAAVRMVRVLGWCLPAAAIGSVLLNGLRGLGSVVGFTTLQHVVLPGLRVALVVAVVALGWGGLPVVLATWALPLPVLLVAVVAVVAHRLTSAPRPDDPLMTDRRPGWVRFWRFSAPRGVAAVLEMLLAWLDVLVVAALSSAADAGVYAVVTRLVRAGLVVDTAVRLAIAPRVARLLAAGELASVDALFTAMARAVILLAWPAYLLLATFGGTVLGLFGDGFGRGEAVLILLSAAMMVGLAAGIVQSMLLMGGRSRDQMVNKAVAVAVNLALNVVLVPAHGITGAAVAWVLTLAVDTTLAVRQVRHRMHVQLDLRALVLPVALATGVFGGGCLLVRVLAGSGPVELVLACLGCGSVYLGCLWGLRARLGLTELLRL